ncbi:S-layer homology domain-containing protein [Paenibacillus sp. NRS-1780]|uniref:S-layer homology domain-containing protein n=1 Tax=Paenibacillus sp. NRS-1780 TaxID=3233904 RepID=UPI003D2A59E6
MTQQSPNQSEDVIYKKRLFYDNGIRFVEVKAKLISEYKPPAPHLKSHVHETFSYSAGLVNRGTSHYTASLTLLFYSKKEYADWLSFIGSEHKYYDEKGTIYLGVVTGKPDIQTAELETKYIIQVQMSLIRKQGDEYRCKSQFIDLKGHWASSCIEEMEQRGMVPIPADEGEISPYFRPDEGCTRAEGITFLMRSYRYVDRILRGY